MVIVVVQLSIVINVLVEVPLIPGKFGDSSDGRLLGTTIIDAFMNWIDQNDSSYVPWTWDVVGDSGGLTLYND